MCLRVAPSLARPRDQFNADHVILDQTHAPVEVATGATKKARVEVGSVKEALK